MDERERKEIAEIAGNVVRQVLSEFTHGDGGDLTMAAKVAALDKQVSITASLAFDVRKDIDTAVKGVHDRLDRMNGSVADHEKRIDGHDIRLAFASGGVAVLTMLIMVFGGIILVKAWP